MMGLVQLPEPESAELRQYPPLVGNSVGQHEVEGADPIGADQQQPVAQVVNIPYFAAANRPIVERRL